MSELSEFAPTDLIQEPELKLEDVRKKGPTCTGRGKGTAAVRGYNTERLATAVLDYEVGFLLIPLKPYFDTCPMPAEDIGLRVECKSCVQRYPSGPYGRFRIWKHHHESFVEEARSWRVEGTMHVYFFLVYTVEWGVVREVGKLVVPAEAVDEVLDRWSKRDHPTMGERWARDISWHLLLEKLGVPERALVEHPLVDLTDGLDEPSEEC